MRVVAFLPAKGSSNRVENKNLRLLDGKPLFLHTLEKLVACDFVDQVYLDTESEEMIDLASHTGCQVLRRDPALATNKTDGHQLFFNEVRQVEADIYIQILCTSPFIDTETIRRGIGLLADTSEFDSVVLVRREKQYTWGTRGPNYPIAHIPNSADLPDTVLETMGLYIMRADAAKRLRRRIGDHPFQLEATPLEALDVNWPEDLDLANLVAAGLRERDRKLLANIRNQLTSSLLSDLLDDAGYRQQVIPNLGPNIPGSRVLGRAKTLRLRLLREGEDFRGIYRALDSYKTIVPNDIIVVENEAAEYAYFGELNANLAQRSGASGAVIGGMTRDSQDVARIGFPVFARGTSCADVRKRATVDTINRPICVFGVSIQPGDLVFADEEGVVVVPRAVERRVIGEALAQAVKERRLLLDVSAGIDVDELTRRYGFF